MDNREKIIKIIKILEKDKSVSNIKKILKDFEWPEEIFFISLIAQIIQELNTIQQKIKEQNFKTDDESFLFQVIQLFCNVKYHIAPSRQIINYIITKQNIDVILNSINNTFLL